MNRRDYQNLDEDQKNKIKEVIKYVMIHPDCDIAELEDKFGTLAVSASIGFIHKDEKDICYVSELGDKVTSGEFDLPIVDIGFMERQLDYTEIAKKYDDLYPIIYDTENNWWLWDSFNKRWKMIDDIDILLSIYKSTNFSGIVNHNVKSQITTALKMVGRDRFLKIKIPKDTWILFKNRIVDVYSGEEITPSPEYFIVNRIPHDLGISKETPYLDKLLLEWMSGNKDEVIKLKEIMAYCLLPNYPIHRMFILTGSGRNGKTTYVEVIEKLIGLDNMTSVSVGKLLSSKFHASKLYKKLAAVAGETNFKAIEDTENIKKLTGHDLFHGEFKNKPEFDFRNYAKIIINTNSIPPTADKTDGWYGRTFIIDFKQKFNEERDILKDLSDEELSNFCLASLEILKNLLEKGKFTNEGTIQDRKERYEEKSNPILSFIDKFCIKDINGEIPKYLFRDKVITYCNERGYRGLTEREISLKMKDYGYEDEKKRVYVDNFIDRGNDEDDGHTKNPIWHWIGIRLKTKDEIIMEEESSTVPIVPIVPLISLKEYICKSKVEGKEQLELVEHFGHNLDISTQKDLLISLINDNGGCKIEYLTECWDKLKHIFQEVDLIKLLSQLSYEKVVYSPRVGEWKVV